MRTFVIGSKDLSVGILQTLLNQGHEVLGVFSRDDEPEMKIWHEKLKHRSLKAEAKKHKVPVYEGFKVNSKESRDLLKSLDLDIIFSCFWSEIFRKETLDIPKFGVFNFHTAFLPFNRGSRSIPWALIEGQNFTGMTIHKMNPGIDDGPIVAQIEVPITKKDTAKTLYNKVTQAGLQLFETTLPNFSDGSFALISQDESQSTYHPRGEPFGGQINVFWSDNKQDRFKRAFDFEPFRKHRESPKNLNESGKSKVWWILDHSLPFIELPTNDFTWKRNDIGSNEERKKIKAQFENLDGKGIAISHDIHEMYPIHDVLVQLGIKFVVSKRVETTDWIRNIASNQPFRYENGLLEIPSILVDNTNDLDVLFKGAQSFQNEFNQDIFIGLISHNEEQITFISEQIEKFGGRVLTFTEVYHHFNTEYEKIIT